MDITRRILSKTNILQAAHINKRFTSKIAVELDNELTKKLENEEMKPRQHPGIYKTGQLSLPDYVVKGIRRSIGDYPVKSLIIEGNKISTYFKARHPPPENEQVRKKVSEIEMELDARFPSPNFSNMSEKEISRYKDKREMKIKRNLKQRIFAWKPMEYGQFESLCYAIGRGALEYGILMKIFKEIEFRDGNYKPQSYFDFGSGIGTGMWAASTLWKDSIFEYFNVDSSRDMNELSEMILRSGSENKEMYLNNVYYRQFLPANDTKYDLCVSAFSLFELSSRRNRRDVILNLWKRCSGYMVIVENGTRAGFELISEARDFVLDLANEEDLEGHIFSPCPHEKVCPRLSSSEDRTPCNFVVTYEKIPFEGLGGHRRCLYSYIVFKKGKKEENADADWPRIVRPTLVRTRHTICRLCTSKGNLQEIIFTPAKHGKMPYQCARSSSWGDRLPISIGEKYENKKVKNHKIDTSIKPPEIYE